MFIIHINTIHIPTLSRPPPIPIYLFLQVFPIFICFVIHVVNQGCVSDRGSGANHYNLETRTHSPSPCS